MSYVVHFPVVHTMKTTKTRHVLLTNNNYGGFKNTERCSFPDDMILTDRWKVP